MCLLGQVVDWDLPADVVGVVYPLEDLLRLHSCTPTTCDSLLLHVDVAEEVQSTQAQAAGCGCQQCAAALLDIEVACLIGAVAVVGGVSWFNLYLHGKFRCFAFAKAAPRGCVPMCRMLESMWLIPFVSQLCHTVSYSSRTRAGLDATV